MREETGKQGSSEESMEPHHLAFQSALLDDHRSPPSYWGCSKFVLVAKIIPSRDLTQQAAFPWQSGPLGPQEECSYQ